MKGLIRAGIVAALLSCATPAPAQGTSPIDGLTSKDVAARREAANRVRLADRAVQRQALPTLIDLLGREKDGQVRLAVLDAVTALGPEAEGAVPALIQTLRTNYGGGGQEESHQDYRSALALASIGKPAVEGLRGLLKERKESVRAEVVMALGRVGPDSAPAVPDLIPLLGDKGDRIRREACRSLALIGEPAIEALIAASTDARPEIRRGAIASLGQSTATEERVARTLIGATTDADPEVRSAAVRSLARLRRPEAEVLPIALAALRNDDERVLIAAVELLMQDRALLIRLAPDLESLLATGSDGEAHHAAFLLGRLGLDAVPRLLGALRREGARVEEIAGALAQVGRPAVDPLDRSLGDPDPRVRRGSALALGQIRPLAPGTAGRLARGLTDADPDARLAFLVAIGKLGPRASEAVPVVRGMLLDASAEVRGRAIEVLVQAAPREGSLVDDLASRLDDPDPGVQRRAIDALHALGPAARKTLPAAIARLASPDPGVRLAALGMVESHGPAATEAIPALGALLADPSPRLRTVAATTLGRFGKDARPAFEPLANLVADADPAVREAAASALGALEMDAEAVRPPIARALLDDKAEVRRAASRAIPRLGPSGVILVPDIIRMAARKENARQVDRLLRPFERDGPDVRSLPELVELLGNDQVPVRLLAIKFLGLAGRNARAALPALERIREDPSTEVRQQVKAACDQIKNDAESPRPRDPAAKAP